MDCLKIDKMSSLNHCRAHYFPISQPPESTSKGWILLFYRVGSKTGSTREVFERHPTLFKFKGSQNILEFRTIEYKNKLREGHK